MMEHCCKVVKNVTSSCVPNSEEKGEKVHFEMTKRLKTFSISHALIENDKYWHKIACCHKRQYVTLLKEKNALLYL